MRYRFNGMTIVALSWVVLIALLVLADTGSAAPLVQTGGAIAPTPAAAETGRSAAPANPDVVAVAAVEPAAEAVEAAPPESEAFTFTGGEEEKLIAAPYTDFVLTQGLHGWSYGHNAIDLYAGKGEPVLSPINGVVVNYFVDQYGNTNLEIENAYYRVLLLHGNYSVEVGQRVALGEPVGTEWNNGYTLDFQGNLCTGRDCGYHTHLNIFDKLTGTNADPLALLNL